MLEKVVARLLDHILERDKARFILVQALLQGGNGLLDGRTVLAHRSLLGFGTNKALRENGQHQLKRLFPFGLLAQHSADHFAFASPLTITVRQWACDVLPDLLPGR